MSGNERIDLTGQVLPHPYQNVIVVDEQDDFIEIDSDESDILFSDGESDFDNDDQIEVTDETNERMERPPLPSLLENNAILSVLLNQDVTRPSTPIPSETHVIPQAVPLQNLQTLDQSVPLQASTSAQTSSANSINHTNINNSASSSLVFNVPNISAARTFPITSSTTPILSVPLISGQNVIQQNVVQTPPRTVPNAPSPARSPFQQRVQAIVDQNTSLNEFRTPKKRKLMSPENKKSPNKEESDDEGDTCPICFELWTTSGAHRLISLKCGHLFGQSCIKKWLKGQGGKCPQCNAKAKSQDIRVLYAKGIKALDTSERDRALGELAKERESKRKMELEKAQLSLRYQQSIEECNILRNDQDILRRELELLRSQSSNSTFSMSQPSTSITISQSACTGQFKLDTTISISQEGKCRVLAYSSSLATLLVSQPSNSHLFKGFGVKKISTMDLKTFQYVPIHANVIRDICFHPVYDDGMLLSCGMDKTIKITNIMSNTIVQTYESSLPVWSCVWNTSNKLYFYAGLSNGTVLEYDTRNTSEAVQEINKEAKRAPVVSLQYVSKDDDANFKQEGLLVGQLDQTSFYEKKNENELRLHLLPLDGSLTSLCFDSTSRQLLASFRSSTKYPYARHQLCRLTSSRLSESQSIDDICSSSTLHSLRAGKAQATLSRSTLFHTGDNSNRLIICGAGNNGNDESTATVQTWDGITGQQLQKLPCGGVPLDMLPININNTKHLAVLLNTQLKIYRWQ